MEKSKVYYTDFRTTIGVGLPKKLQMLCKKAGLQTIDMDNKFVAIKIHFGELGNIAYLRPNYAKAVADLVKEAGGMPFLTDWNNYIICTTKSVTNNNMTACCSLIKAVLLCTA